MARVQTRELTKLKACLLCLCVPLFLLAQEDLTYRVSLQTTNGWGDYNPLWLNANKYGLSSLSPSNGYLQAGIYRPLSEGDATRKWDFGYGLSLAGAYDFTSPFIVQEAYAEARWLKGRLTVGSKEYPMELKNAQLSSGSQALGINARPVPQVRIALPSYWNFARGWLGLKGHIAYGLCTDDNWQSDFTGGATKHTKKVMYHSKAGYLRIGNEERFPLSLELGLEMACLFGGTSYRLWEGEYAWVENKKGLGAMVDAFFGMGSDVGEGLYGNVGGNQLGAWVARLNFDAPAWNVGIYADHFFEDHSQMFLLDYDGYGTGDKWNEKVDNRFLLYELKDIMLGAELKLKHFKWMNTLVLEYLYTKYQSGPIYHDRTESIPDHIAGCDDYYNHSITSGWQHWGMVIGNPLYRSPLYNTNHSIRVDNNRFVAYHAGIAGNPSEECAYRILASYQTGYGTYERPFTNPRYNLSCMAEVSYKFSEDTAWKGWGITAAFGMDKGGILGDNYGFQLTVSKSGVIDFKKNKQ